MTISQSFVEFLESKGFGTFGQNIYLYRVPNSKKTQTELFWIVPTGGTPTRRNRTGELIKAYQFSLYYRSMSAKKIDEVLNQAEEMLNCATCVQLNGFELVDIQATQFPISQDLDSEDRVVGLLQVQLQVYKGC